MPDFVDVSDHLNRSSVLRRASRDRAEFDPDNSDHIESLQMFMRTGNWGKVQFYCEHPYTDVPMTVLMKFIHATLGTRRETVTEQAQRFATAGLVEATAETNAQRLARLAETNRKLLLRGTKAPEKAAAS